MDPTNDSALYAALLQRRSVRRYQRTPLPADLLAEVLGLAGRIQPLLPANTFRIQTRPQLRVDRAALRAFGAYGALVNPPHALIPCLYGEQHPLLDWGYRAQQLITGITQLGLGSCYIGVVGRQPAVRRRLELPNSAYLGALLIFGHPLRTVADPAARRKRLPLHELFFDHSFDQPAAPPDALLPILTAAQAAPSAVNTQPWRFLWQEPWLHLFVRRVNPSYLSPANQAYRHVDGGIVMANITHALTACARPSAWALPSAGDVPPHPPALEYLACIRLA